MVLRYGRGSNIRIKNDDFYYYFHNIEFIYKFKNRILFKQRTFRTIREKIFEFMNLFFL